MSTASHRALSAVVIQVPTTTAQLDNVRALMTAFVDWSRVRYADYLDQVNAYFSADAFQAELAGLPGNYAPPNGHLLLAELDGEPAGCVALRRFDSFACEMKRMFVSPPFQGRGVGRALAETLIREARSIGYRRMLLDTGFLQTEAQNLYRSLGFVEIEPYYPVPDVVRRGALFMELDLAMTAASAGSLPREDQRHQE
jgi:putative acetyltransferase